MATKAKGKAQTSAPETYTCAMDKLRDEMAKSQQRYVQVVGEYLTDYLQRHPEAEEKLMEPGKSIEGSLGAMKDEASKHKQGSVGILDDATAFRVVLRYYGIVDNAPGQTAQEATAFPLASPPVGGEVARQSRDGEGANPPAPDPFDLDALMGGL